MLWIRQRPPLSCCSQLSEDVKQLAARKDAASNDDSTSGAPYSDDDHTSALLGSAEEADAANSGELSDDDQWSHYLACTKVTECSNDTARYCFQTI